MLSRTVRTMSVLLVLIICCVRSCAHVCQRTLFADGKTGFTEHAVRYAWKIANAGDSDGERASQDKDKMKLDWHEYQACIRILAKRAGVSLTTDVAVDGSERYFVFILVTNIVVMSRNVCSYINWILRQQ